MDIRVDVDDVDNENLENAVRFAYCSTCKKGHKLPRGLLAPNAVFCAICSYQAVTVTKPDGKSHTICPQCFKCVTLPHFFLLAHARHHIASHHIKSHHITSHRVTSHHIASHHIPSHHITSHHITSRHITSHHITSRHITSHHITSHHITSRHITSRHITSHRVTSHHITPLNSLRVVLEEVPFIIILQYFSLSFSLSLTLSL